MKYQYKILQTETKTDGFLPVKRYRLQHSLFAGGTSAELIRERVEGYTAASLLPYDPVTDQVVLIEQFRIGALEDKAGAWIIEVVGELYLHRLIEPQALAIRKLDTRLHGRQHHCAKHLSE